MCDKVITIAKTLRDKTKDFPIRINLHQGLALSSYLFNMVFNVLTIQKITHKCIIFADNIV